MLRNFVQPPIPVYNPMNNLSTESQPQATESQPQATESQPQGNQRKCSMCNKPGHNIKQCNDAASKNRLNEIETRFTNTMKNRLSTNWNDSSMEYRNLVDELRNTVPMNLMKFAVIKFGAYSTRLKTKLKLFGMFMYQMIRRFMNLDEFRGTVSRIKVQLLNAERSFWIWIYSGNSLQSSHQMYNQLVRDIHRGHANATQPQEMTLFPIKIILIMDLSESNGMDNVEDDVSETCNPETVSIFDCDICFDNKPADTKVTFDCGHSFCGVCVQTTFEICKTSSKKPTCAMCRHEYNSVTVTSDNILSELQKFCK